MQHQGVFSMIGVIVRKLCTVVSVGVATAASFGIAFVAAGGARDSSGHGDGVGPLVSGYLQPVVVSASLLAPDGTPFEGAVSVTLQQQGEGRLTREAFVDGYSSQGALTLEFDSELYDCTQPGELLIWPGDLLMGRSEHSFWVEASGGTMARKRLSATSAEPDGCVYHRLGRTQLSEAPLYSTIRLLGPPAGEACQINIRNSSALIQLSGYRATRLTVPAGVQVPIFGWSRRSTVSYSVLPPVSGAAGAVGGQLALGGNHDVVLHPLVSLKVVVDVSIYPDPFSVIIFDSNEYWLPSWTSEAAQLNAFARCVNSRRATHDRDSPEVATFSMVKPGDYTIELWQSTDLDSSPAPSAVLSVSIDGSGDALASIP